MKQIYINSYFKGFNSLSSYSLLKEHPQRDVIKKRMKIMSFFDTYGAKTTKEILLPKKALLAILTIPSIPKATLLGNDLTEP